MHLVDSHSHPQDQRYDADREEVIRKATEEDIGIICVGTDLEMSRKAISLAEHHDNVWASVGLHPNDNLTETFEPDEYLALGRHKRVVAFGEIGLDYYRTTDSDLKITQKRRFVQQIETASELYLPLIIHCRDAHEDMLKLLKYYQPSLNDKPGVVHSFTGSYEEAKQYIDLGFYLGFNGIITFARQYDETINNIPLEHILIETDAPYLTPEPYRGKRNEPVYITYVAQKLAELKNISIDEVSETTTQNTKTLFNL